MEDQRKLACGVAAAGCGASEEEPAYDDRVISTQRALFNHFKAQFSHLFRGVVGAFVARQDLVAPVRKLLAEERDRRRILVGFHEGVEVATVPRGRLYVQNGLRVLARGGQTKYQQNEFSHRWRLYCLVRMQDLKQPENAGELAAALGAAGAAGKRVEVGGRFTKTRWGGRVEQPELTISTAKLTRVLEYEPRDLTISVEAGMPYAQLTSLLAKNQQMIPLDPPYAASASIGGVLAANQSGPRRRLFGTARDLVIGIQFATISGKLVQAGGMVVKNVAGLDMGKLMIGSWGTLGVITSVNFKLTPKDKFTRTFLQSFGSAQDALAERTRILQSVLQPAAVDLLNPAAAQLLGKSGWILAVGTGGSQALIDRYSRELSKADVLDGAEETTFWSAVESFAEGFLAKHERGAIVRASTALANMAPVLTNHNGPIIARAANGVAYLYHEVAPASLAKPNGFWPAPDAHFVMEAGPADRDTAILWPEPASEFPVMEKIKQMLDPQHLLNKGRMYGRI